MSVLGLYTELFSLRMAQIMSQQKAVAEMMMQWHASAYLLAKDNLATINFTATGCSLSGGATPCSVTLTGATATTYLPVGYDNTNADMRFESVVFLDGLARRLVTYIPVGESRLGFTQAQIYQQMRNARLAESTYGYVATGTCAGGTAGTWLMTKAHVTAPSLYQICYAIPLNGGAPIVPVGAVGIATNF